MSDNTTPDFDFDFNGAAENFDEEQRVAAERRRQRAEEDFQRDWKKTFNRFSSDMRKRVTSIYRAKNMSNSAKIEALSKLLDGSTTTPTAADTGSNSELAEANRRIVELEGQLAQARTTADTAADEQGQKYDQLKTESDLVMNAFMELANRADVELTDFELDKPVVNQAVETIVNGFETKYRSTTTNSGNNADQQLLIKLETDIRTGLQKIATKVGVKPVEDQGKIDIAATATRIVAKIETLKTATPTFDVAELRRLTGELVEAHGNSETARAAFEEIHPNAVTSTLSKAAKAVVKKTKDSTPAVITFATADQIDTLDNSMNTEEALIIKIGEELDK